MDDGARAHCLHVGAAPGAEGSDWGNSSEANPDDLARRGPQRLRGHRVRAWRHRPALLGGERWLWNGGVRERCRADC